MEARCTQPNLIGATTQSGFALSARTKHDACSTRRGGALVSTLAYDRSSLNLKGLYCSFNRSSPYSRDDGTLRDRRRNVRQSCGVTRAASAELSAESSGTIIRKRDKVTASVKLLSKTIKQLVESGEKYKTKVDSGELYCDTPLNQDFLDSDRSMCRAVSRCAPTPKRTCYHSNER